MMPLNSFKRKGRLNPNSNKLGKSKFYPEKLVLNDGIYGNSKLMYTAASLVGCVVQIQVQSGAIFEGVLRTFSHQLDVVLEMAHRVTSSVPAKGGGISPVVSNLISSYPFEGGLFDKLIFKLSDICLMVARTVDMDYALKDNFTDCGITKFNGQVQERELEPWEDADSDSEGVTMLGLTIEDEDSTNGWDANDMFRTNAEKYGVTSSYDNSLQDYTVPLLKKDTEEYKLQEARASRIAQEIETNSGYQSRIQLEDDGDEEDRYSAVHRPPTLEDPKYVLPQKRRNPCGLKRQSPTPGSKVFSSTIPSQSLLSVLDETASVPKTGADREKCPLPSKVIYSTQTLPPRIERRRESEKTRHKGRTDEIEEFKKFSTNFKLTDEKECAEVMPVSKVTCTMERIDKEEEEEEDPNNIVKFSTLNPNAKEFVFNPNAKSFTPRSMSVATTPPDQNSVQQMMPHHQPVFTAVAPPQYMMQGAPVSVAITAPFAAATPPPPPPTAPRFRKNAGQPLLAPAPSQLTVQYSSPPPQPTVGYPQMNFVVGPRVMSPHSVSYCDTPHLIMSTHPSVPHTAANSLQQQGSNHHHHHHHHPPPPVLHPSPSPQPPTPTTAVMYPGHHHHHPMQQQHHHPGAYPPQPLVLMQQQHQQQQPLHMHHHPHLIPQVAVIPTSATPPFIQQHP